MRGSSSCGSSVDPAEGMAEVGVTEPNFAKTPLFQATHSARYGRQDLIKRIQNATGRRLVCYVSGDGCRIDRDDTVGFVDILHHVPNNEHLDLLLHTSGGDVDVAEKLISIVRRRVGTAELQIVVPDFAKSAGTLMVLGADRVLMSDTSSLGQSTRRFYSPIAPDTMYGVPFRTTSMPTTSTRPFLRVTRQMPYLA